MHIAIEHSPRNFMASKYFLKFQGTSLDFKGILVFWMGKEEMVRLKQTVKD